MFSRRIVFSVLHEREQRPVELPLLRLVLLRVEVLLAPLAHRHVLEVLVAGVDPVGRRQRRREHEPRLERRPAAALEVLVEDVRRVDEEVRPVVLRPSPMRQLRHVLDQLAARVLPGEVRVRLAEPGLRERGHHRRPRERLREEDDARVDRAHLARSATPRTAAASCAGCRRGRPRTPCETQWRTTSRSASHSPRQSSQSKLTL